MAAPLLAVARAGEQAVEQRGIRLIRRGRRDGAGARERFHFLGRRRQAGEVEGGAADEVARLGRRIHREAVFLEFREQQAIDRRPVAFSLRSAQRLQTPPAFVPASSRLDDQAFGPGRAFRDPPPHECHLVGRQRIALLRHLGRVLAERRDEVHQHAVLRIAADHRILVATALLEKLRGRGQRPFPFLLLGIVAANAALRENGRDLLCEVDRHRGNRAREERNDGEKEDEKWARHSGMDVGDIARGAGHYERE